MYVKNPYMQRSCDITSIRQGAERSRPVHEVQQSDKGNWQNQDDDIDKHIDTVTLKSLSFNRIRSSISTKLKTSSRQKRAKRQYAIDPGSDDNLMPLNIFEILFPRATTDKLAKQKYKRVLLQTYNKKALLRTM